MSYPQLTDYNEAIQNPSHSFIDHELKASNIRTNTLGLPLVLSGGLALTYTAATLHRKYAVRCFKREIPSIESKYIQISRALTSLRSRYFVEFRFHRSGINVSGKPYPIVVMEWIEGDPLGVWLDKNYNNPDALRKARLQFREMAVFLENNGIGHGDIQNGNIMMSNQGIKLIDYDGMYVPGLSLGVGTEIGHNHFQHPQRTTKDYGPSMDRFSFIVLDLSLQALEEDSSLHRRFREGGEAIIFRANDFADTQNSEVFRVLKGKPTLSKAASQLIAICNSNIKDVPSLEEYLSGSNIPVVSAGVTGDLSSAELARFHKYIAAFPVVHACDYTVAAQYVGDRIELIGKIVEVKNGVGKYGRGKSRKYVFVNFGRWRGNIVKLSFWSEALDRISELPSDTWVGRWVSVTGLLDPPYRSRRWGYSHLSISIYDDGQIHFIDEGQALFRLGKGQLTSGTAPGRVPKRAAGGRSPKLNQIDIGNAGRTGTARHSLVGITVGGRVQSPIGGMTSPSSKNRDLVRKFAGEISLPTQSATPALPTQVHTSTTSAQASPQQPQVRAATVSNSIRSLLIRFGWLVLVLFIVGCFAFASQIGQRKGPSRSTQSLTEYTDSSSNKQATDRSSSGSLAPESGSSPSSGRAIELPNIPWTSTVVTSMRITRPPTLPTTTLP